MSPYKINGSEFVVLPSVAKWVEPAAVDIDGNGHPIYPRYTEFELQWNNLSPSGTYQLYEFFRTLHITGSATVELPRYAGPGYAFWEYSGCVVHIPSFGNYFAEQTLDVRLLITKINYDSF